MYMSGDVAGKDWELVRPYHGPCGIVSVTSTNAEVQFKLIQKPSDPTLFVAISRLRRCYPEILVDASWTGRNKRAKRKGHTGRPPMRSKSQRTFLEKDLRLNR